MKILLSEVEGNFYSKLLKCLRLKTEYRLSTHHSHFNPKLRVLAVRPPRDIFVELVTGTISGWPEDELSDLAKRISQRGDPLTEKG